MRQIIRNLFSLSLVCLALSPVVQAVTRRIDTTPTVAEQFLLAEANKDRAAHGLSPVQRDPLLSQAAAFHAEQMAQHGDISHGFPGEPDLSERGAHAGVKFSLITENVAEASNSAVIHDLWMASPGHRANLLDPEVNVVGIAVLVKNHEFYAVEDFASTVEPMSLNQQETTVATILASTGLHTASVDAAAVDDARQTCSMQTGYAGLRQPWFIMRYTASRLDELPTQLKSRLTSGKYHRAVVGACVTTEPSTFSSYNIAILLYP